VDTKDICVQKIVLERVPVFDKLNLLEILTEVKTQGQSLAACATKVYINPLDLSPAKRKNQVNDTDRMWHHKHILSGECKFQAPAYGLHRN
jgi:hypothetical protein